MQDKNYCIAMFTTHAKLHIPLRVVVKPRFAKGVRTQLNVPASGQTQGIHIEQRMHEGLSAAALASRSEQLLWLKQGYERQEADTGVF
jgi:hypothetical protein